MSQVKDQVLELRKFLDAQCGSYNSASKHSWEHYGDTNDDGTTCLHFKVTDSESELNMMVDDKNVDTVYAEFLNRFDPYIKNGEEFPIKGKVDRIERQKTTAVKTIAKIQTTERIATEKIAKIQTAERIATEKTVDRTIENPKLKWALFS